jgi:ankyrin repeat protein
MPPGLPKKMWEEEIRSAPFDLADAQLSIVRWYDFANSERLREYVEALSAAGSPVALFETPLHQAALAGHDAVVRLLVERGARLDIKDTIYEATPLEWAEYGGRTRLQSIFVAR